MTHPGVSEIVKRFKRYNSDINEVFEDYLFIAHYFPILHKQIKNGKVEIMQFESAFTEYKAPFKKDYVYGVIDRMIKKSNPENAFIDSVTLTEDFLQSITYRVYRDFPFKLETKDESQDQKEKFIKLLLTCNDKEEMICRIAEEKIRGIFYGNPVDFFEKDKARIGIGTYLKDNYNKALSEYSEIIARRNIYIHNHGRVDSKYLKEVTITPLQLDDKPIIDKEYIRHTIKILRSLSVITTKLVIEKTYGAPNIKTRLQEYIDKFDKEYKNK